MYGRSGVISSVGVIIGRLSRCAAGTEEKRGEVEAEVVGG